MVSYNLHISKKKSKTKKKKPLNLCKKKKAKYLGKNHALTSPFLVEVNKLRGKKKRIRKSAGIGFSFILFYFIIVLC